MRRKLTIGSSQRSGALSNIYWKLAVSKSLFWPQQQKSIMRTWVKTLLCTICFWVLNVLVMFVMGWFIIEISTFLLCNSYSRFCILQYQFLRGPGRLPLWARMLPLCPPLVVGEQHGHVFTAHLSTQLALQHVKCVVCRRRKHCR